MIDKKLSMVDNAYEILKLRHEDQPKTESKEINFFDLWNEIVKIKEFTEEEADEKQSNFYTNITLDGRFITTGENNWDLRAFHKYDEVHIDMKDIYSEDDEEKDDEDDVDGDSIDEEDYSENK